MTRTLRSARASRQPDLSGEIGPYLALAEHHRRDEPADQPEQVRLPGEPGVGREYLGKLDAVQQADQEPDRDPPPAALDDPADEQEADVPEDHAAGPDHHRVRVAGEPHAQPAGQRDQDGDTDEPPD